MLSTPRGIYNFDKIRFLEGQGHTQAVVTRNSIRKRESAILLFSQLFYYNRELLTSISLFSYQVSWFHLLLIDNYSAHLTHKFIEWCQQYRILLYFPPHSIHFLQLLDQKPFQQYKHYYGEAVNETARTLYPSFEKVEFLQYLLSIQQKAFKS